jgi:hypothetical protein
LRCGFTVRLSQCSWPSGLRRLLRGCQWCRTRTCRSGGTFRGGSRLRILRLYHSRLLRNRRRQRRRKECGACCCANCRRGTRRQGSRRCGLSAGCRRRSHCRRTLVCRGTSLWCESLSGRDRLRLTARVGDRNGVGCVVDDDRVVDVVVDDIRRWWRYVGWRIVIGGDRHIVGDRQNKKAEYRRRWCQNHKFRWRWRQEKYWRRRWRSEIVVRVIEVKHRSTEINHFVFGRRRHIVRDDSKRWRRFKCRGQIGQTTVCVGYMWTARIPAKIGPIRLRRVD